MILLSLMKRLAIIIPVFAVSWQIFLEHARFLLMLHQHPEPEEPNACFLARYRPKNCRFSVHGRNLHLKIKPEVTGWNIFRYFFIRFAGILKSATMNRKLSGRYAATWYGAARALRWWSIWSMLLIVRWSYCHIKMKAFLISEIKACRISVLH